MRYIKTYENLVPSKSEERSWFWEDDEDHPILGARVGDIVVNITKIGNGELTTEKSYRISQIFDQSIYCDTIQSEVTNTNDMIEVENLDGSPVLNPKQYVIDNQLKVIYEPTRTRAAWFIPELDWNANLYNL